MERKHSESNQRLSRVGRSYAADQPSGKSASAVQVSGTTLWTTDHNLVLHQDGFSVYQTTGQDKTALTGSDAIWFENQAGKIGGERTMTVANTESHNLTIDGTGSGAGSGGWLGKGKSQRRGHGSEGPFTRDHTHGKTQGNRWAGPQIA